MVEMRFYQGNNDLPQILTVSKKLTEKNGVTLTIIQYLQPCARETFLSREAAAEAGNDVPCHMTAPLPLPAPKFHS